jgi:hypothetical protein
MSAMVLIGESFFTNSPTRIGKITALCRLRELQVLCEGPERGLLHEFQRLDCLAQLLRPLPVRHVLRKALQPFLVLEVKVGEEFRTRSNAWLVVDGSLAESPAFARDGRMLGVSKSHATLPFGGADLETYLRLPPGHRTSVFRPASRRFAPVYAWGLRLWPWEGRDLLFGLVRVEAAPTAESLARADEFSRWLLAERAPVSAPDARWDRLLYGIHNVEDFLAAVVPAHS